MNADLDSPRAQVLLALGDDELVIGHRHLHWTGVAPSLEEDLAFSTLGQDEINHADVWYQVLVGTDGVDQRAAVDAIGLGRQPERYRHAVLCERPAGTFADTLARQLLYDHFDQVRLQALTGSADHEVAAVAAKLLHEERYHTLHAVEWVERIARGGPDAAGRLGAALADCWPDAAGLFEGVAQEPAAVAAGLLPVPFADLVEPWLQALRPTLERAGYGQLLDTPVTVALEPGGRRGVHTADWTEEAWVEMTWLYRAHPDARW